MCLESHRLLSPALGQKCLCDKDEKLMLTQVLIKGELII